MGDFELWGTLGYIGSCVRTFSTKICNIDEYIIQHSPDFCAKLEDVKWESLAMLTQIIPKQTPSSLMRKSDYFSTQELL